MKQKLAAIISLIALTFIMALTSCVPISDGASGDLSGQNNASVTITLPKLGGSSSIRALSEEQVSRLQSETVKFRITFKNNGMTTTRETTGGPVTAIFEIGSEVKITVECLNAKQQVIVRSVEKTITMKSGANSLSFKLSEDGEEIILENDDDGEEGDDDDGNDEEEEQTKFEVSYELDGGEWNPTFAPPQPTEYAVGDTVTITANTPTKQGLVFGGWKPSVESLSPAGENFYKKDTFTMPSEAVTLTAQWGTVSRTVLYDDGLFVMNELDVNARSVGVTAEYDAMLDDGSNYVFQASSAVTWYEKRKEIKSVKIGSPMFPANTRSWFVSLSNCTDIDLSQLNTSKVTDMGYMFSGCSGLTELDVSGFETLNVTDMAQMFYNCGKLTSLDLSSFNTSKVTKMNLMFYNCGSLTELDVSSFETPNVTTMEWMFDSCGKLTSLDLSGFNTSNVTNISRMFNYCKKLTTIYVSNDFDTSKVTDSSSMFNYCSALVGGSGTTHDAKNINNKTYARIDNPPDAPGYFTDISQKP